MIIMIVIILLVTIIILIIILIIKKKVMNIVQNVKLYTLVSLTVAENEP